MSVSDTRLMVASKGAFRSAIPATTFSEYVETSPRVMRVQFDDFSESSGRVALQDGALSSVFCGALSDLAAAVPCFTANSAITTQTGQTLISDLKPGQKIMTRDNGFQALRWIGKRSFGWRALGLNPKVRAITLKAGALGEGRPVRDMTVSPNHKILMLTQSDERLIVAADLLHLDGVFREDGPQVCYYQLLCDTHELLLVDECWSESYRATTAGLAALDDVARAELLELVPDLASGGGGYAAVRAESLAQSVSF